MSIFGYDAPVDVIRLALLFTRRHPRAGGNPTPILLAPITVAAKVEVRSWAPAYAGVTKSFGQ
jgi:hypothetical protein